MGGAGDHGAKMACRGVGVALVHGYLQDFSWTVKRRSNVTASVFFFRFSYRLSLQAKGTIMVTSITAEYLFVSLESFAPLPSSLLFPHSKKQPELKINDLKVFLPLSSSFPRLTIR
jgi:hypothetical protein